MKIAFTCICLLFSVLSSTQILTIDPNKVEFFEDNADLNISYTVPVDLINNATDTVNVKWLLEAENCPSEWKIGAFDKNITYTPFVTSNYDASQGTNFPVTLLPNEISENFGTYLFPTGQTGCCRVKLHVSLIENPDEIINTVTFDYRINEPDCEFTNTSNLDIESFVQLSPNPTNDFFKIVGSTDFESLKIYNSNGQFIRQFPVQSTNEYHLDDLPNGLYFVHLAGREPRVLKLILR